VFSLFDILHLSHNTSQMASKIKQFVAYGTRNIVFLILSCIANQDKIERLNLNYPDQIGLPLCQLLSMGEFSVVAKWMESIPHYKMDQYVRSLIEKMHNIGREINSEEFGD